MRLTKIDIPDYKIFKDFKYEFPLDSNILNNVIIGVNGSGKSTILEVIAKLFSCLFLDNKIDIECSLHYKIKTFKNLGNEKDYRTIELKGEKGKVPQLFVKLNTGAHDKVMLPNISTLPLFENDYGQLVPKNIVVYYSGLSEKMAQLCSQHEEEQKRAYLDGDYSVQRRFFYYRPENFNMLLLALLSFEYGNIKDYVYNKLKITELSGFVVKMQRPQAKWAKGKKAKDVWGAQGIMKDFCNNLGQFSKYTTISKDDSFIEYHFPTMDRLYSIKDHYGEERRLFELFDMALYEGLLYKIDISLNKGIIQNGSIPQEGELHFNSEDLSEGEQQSIIIKGLSELLAQENTMFLFDEPDTYLHPKWQRQFIHEIENTIEQNSNNEINYLIATHSPQLLSNANPEKTSVRIIEDGKLIDNTPKYYGREISSILYNLMGVEERNKTIKNDLSNLFTLIEDEEIEEAEQELVRLTEILGETDPDIKDAELQIKYLKEDEADS